MTFCQVKFPYHCKTLCKSDVWLVMLDISTGGLAGPDELLDQPHYNNPRRDGVHSSEHRAGAGRSRCFCEGESLSLSLICTPALW